MKNKRPEGYFDYVVPPLEGLWWIDGGELFFEKRDNWRWTLMIRQPEFVTREVSPGPAGISREKTGPLRGQSSV